jgi:hypothetical protein
MMGTKKLSEIRRELTELFAKLPGGPKAWFEREIRATRGQAKRDVSALETLLAAAIGRPSRKRRRRRTSASQTQ